MRTREIGAGGGELVSWIHWPTCYNRVEGGLRKREILMQHLYTALFEANL